jgi:hypothetical protein
MFKEHQVVQTKECITRFYYKGFPAALPSKSRGTVIHVWDSDVYDVEFPQYGRPFNEAKRAEIWRIFILLLRSLWRYKEERPIIETLYEHELEACKEAL